MTGQTILYLVLGAFAGGFINGLSGTGTALFALGFFLLVLEPTTAVGIVTVMAVLAGFQGLWLVRSDIGKHPARLMRFLIPGLIGVPFGLRLLEVLDAGTLRMGISVLLILYGGYFGFRAALPAFQRKTPLLDCSIGLVGGVLGGAAGVSGALPSMWMSMRPWTKTELRAVLQPFNMVILCTTVALLFWKGVYDRTAMSALLIALPTGLLAAQVGLYVFKRLTDTGFRRLLILLTLLTGLGILVSEVM